MGSTAVAALLLLLATAPTVFAVTFLVGDSLGWATGVNFTTWVNGKTFRVGDTLEFKYGPIHSVAVVNKAGYDRCDDGSATEFFSDGDTKINLTRAGSIHFVCSTPGHCQAGMKLAVLVSSAASSISPSPSPSPSLSSTNLDNTKNVASKRIMSNGKIGWMIVLMYVMLS